MENRDGTPERDELRKMLSGGRHAARKLKRGQILLAANAGESDEAIAANVGVGGFSELGQFLHLPVRNYSSGMAVRLAFLRWRLPSRPRSC